MKNVIGSLFLINIFRFEFRVYEENGENLKEFKRISQSLFTY